MTEHTVDRTTGASQADVLIVGAGPCGLAMACELLRHGLSVRLIDAKAQPAEHSKALLLWPRTLDILEDLGELSAAEHAGQRLGAFRYFSGRKLLTTINFAPSLASVCLPQVQTEQVLTNCLHKLGGNVERQVRLQALEGIDPSGEIRTQATVTAILAHGDGRIERTAVPWVIGADGPGSTVRSELGFSFEGATYEQAFMLADCLVDGVVPAREAHYYQSPQGIVVMVALPGNRYRFFTNARPDQHDVTLPMIQQIVDERGPAGVRLYDPQSMSIFRVHRRRSTGYRVGPVFLIGDAAHVHSPAGGQGLNTGIQDAHNLAWKLAAVARGDAEPRLLDTYPPERQVVAEAVMRDTDIQTRLWMVRGRARVAARDAVFRLVDRSGILSRYYAPVMAGRRIRYPAYKPGPGRPRLGTSRRVRRAVGTALPRPVAGELGLTGPDAASLEWTLICNPGRGNSGAEQTGRELSSHWPCVRFAAPGPGGAAHEYLRGLFRSRQGFVLVRPDGHVAAVDSGDLTTIPATLSTLLRSPGAPRQVAAGRTDLLPVR
jgi:2-polyprenyl-6-methoxyphenol hydroxylase-like FAD-dependent oxidoreductase